VSALTLYADGLATLAAVTRFAEYAVAAAVGVTLVSVAVCGVAGVVGRRRRPARHSSGRPAGRPGACLPLVPAARRAPDDLTV
jgi:hypothetical protein